MDCRHTTPAQVVHRCTGIKMRKLSLIILSIFAICGVTASQAQERLELEGTEIIGNKELPRVLYIVPWKSVERFEIKSPPVVSILDQKLTPLDRASFKRKIHYHHAIFARAELTETVSE